MQADIHVYSRPIAYALHCFRHSSNYRIYPSRAELLIVCNYVITKLS